MTAFSAAVDVIFADPNMAADASWLEAGFAPGLPVRVIVRAPDETQTFASARVQQPTTIIDVRVSEVTKPAEGDKVVIGGETFTVQGAPRRDLRRLIWSVSLRLI